MGFLWIWFCISYAALVKGNSIYIQLMDSEAPYSRGLCGNNDFSFYFSSLCCFDQNEMSYLFAFCDAALCSAVSSICHMCVVSQPGGIPTSLYACRHKMVILNRILVDLLSCLDLASISFWVFLHYVGAWWRSNFLCFNDLVFLFHLGFSSTVCISSFKILYLVATVLLLYCLLDWHYYEVKGNLV